MPTYKLVYFDGKGRAETARLAFHAAGIKFEDVRVSEKDWPNLKPKTFSGKVPYLEVDGKALTESMAIARYAGREAGLMGKTNFEQAIIESVIDAISGLLEKSVALYLAPVGLQKEAVKKEFLEKNLPETAHLLEKFMGDKQFLTSDELSLADLHFFATFEFFPTLSISWEDSYPRLKELFGRVANHPRVADYIKSRPKTNF